MLVTLVLVFGLPFAAYLYFRYRRDLISGIGQVPHRCSRCHEELPRFRLPRSFRQAILGGWTCKRCGSEIDRHGLVHEG
jgi:DNA-directed RNA polymerase subunit RPC12/RpoP